MQYMIDQTGHELIEGKLHIWHFSKPAEVL
jgi:hypothetical protein